VQIRPGAELAAGVVGRGHISGVAIAPLTAGMGFFQKKSGSHFRTVAAVDRQIAELESKIQH
jgi:hypothetical protein